MEQGAVRGRAGVLAASDGRGVFGRHFFENFGLYVRARSTSSRSGMHQGRRPKDRPRGLSNGRRPQNRPCIFLCILCCDGRRPYDRPRFLWCHGRRPNNRPRILWYHGRRPKDRPRILWFWNSLPVLPIGRGGWQPKLPHSLLLLLLHCLLRLTMHFLMDSRVKVLYVLMDCRVWQI